MPALYISLEIYANLKSQGKDNTVLLVRMLGMDTKNRAPKTYINGLEGHRRVPQMAKTKITFS